MFTVIGIMFGGIAIGYLLKNMAILRHIHKTISWTILALLFFLGISVGLNETIINNLQILGIQALLIAILGTAGSILAAWSVYHAFFKENGKS